MVVSTQPKHGACLVGWLAQWVGSGATSAANLSAYAVSIHAGHDDPVDRSGEQGLIPLGHRLTGTTVAMVSVVDNPRDECDDNDLPQLRWRAQVA